MKTAFACIFVILNVSPPVKARDFECDLILDRGVVDKAIIRVSLDAVGRIELFQKMPQALSNLVEQ